MDSVEEEEEEEEEEEVEYGLCRGGRGAVEVKSSNCSLCGCRSKIESEET